MRSRLSIKSKNTSLGIKYFDPWLNSPAWVFFDSGTVYRGWMKCTVVQCIPAQIRGGTWEFHIKLENESICKIKTEATDELEIEFKLIKRRHVIKGSKLGKIFDMTSLPFLNEPEMIECILQRFYAKNIYTNIGNILLAVNPFQKLAIYSMEDFARFCENNTLKALQTEPHVFQMCQRAYLNMVIEKNRSDQRENQSILINGESGAGKTETTKYILRYLAEVSSRVTSKLGLGNFVEDQVIASNPITESFGNAKTLHNNNSSRFGKFIELSYTAEGYIKEATIYTYLLETVRVVHQSNGERNFHIFYEIFSGLNCDYRKDLGLTFLHDFYYTGQSGIFKRNDGENDRDSYNKLRDAMTTLQLDVSIQDGIIQIIAAILHVGNLSFDEVTVTGVEVAVFSSSCQTHITKICQLLGFTEITLLHAIARRTITIAGNGATAPIAIEKTLNAEGALAARDNLAKTLYDSLFRWIVNETNKVMSSSGSTSGVKKQELSTSSFIGVLDIFGFESYEINSFEQLCINYTNEKLQDRFNYSVFKREQEIYLHEGLKWSTVDYPDNSSQLDLLENRVYGIFPLCDEQLKYPKCSDESLALSLYNKCNKIKCFSVTNKERANYEFTINHFAGDVRYQTIGFLNKNRGEVSKELHDCLFLSSNDLVRSLNQEIEVCTSTTHRRHRHRQRVTGTCTCRPTPCSPSSLSSCSSSSSPTSTASTSREFFHSKSFTFSMDYTQHQHQHQHYNSQKILQCHNDSQDCQLQLGEVDLQLQSTSTYTNRRSVSHSGIPATATTNTTTAKSSTVYSTFSRQLHQLLSKINMTRSHFIRCIKPNVVSKPDLFDSWHVMEQLRCGGALSAVQVLRAGYPIRWSYESFVVRYFAIVYPVGMNLLAKEFYYLWKYTHTTTTTSSYFKRLLAIRLLGIIPLAEDILATIEGLQYRLDENRSKEEDISVCITQIFLRAHMYDHLELLSTISKRLFANRLLLVYRAWKTVKLSLSLSLQARHIATRAILHFSNHKRRKVIRIQAATLILQRRSRVFLTVLLKRKMLRSIILFQALFRRFTIRLRKARTRDMWRAVIRIQSMCRRYLVRRSYNLISYSIPMVAAAAAAVAVGEGVSESPLESESRLPDVFELAEKPISSEKDQLQLETESVIRIQCFFRKRLASKLVATYRRDELEKQRFIVKETVTETETDEKDSTSKSKSGFLDARHNITNAQMMSALRALLEANPLLLESLRPAPTTGTNIELLCSQQLTVIESLQNQLKELSKEVVILKTENEHLREDYVMASSSNNIMCWGGSESLSGSKCLIM